METINLIILAILGAGIVGSIVPMMPGALISLLGVMAYGFLVDDPSILFFVFGAVTGTIALIFDWLAGSIAASVGGASRKTSIAAGIAGFLGFFLLGGPLGLVAAVGTVVFLREYLVHPDEKESARAAFYASIGVLGSAVVQAVLTASILLGFIVTLII